MRSGYFKTVSLAVNANNAILPYNSGRRYLYLGSTNSAAIYVFIGSITASNSGGLRMAVGQPGIEFRYEDIGDLICQPVSIWNAGSLNPMSFVEGIAHDECV